MSEDEQKGITTTQTDATTVPAAPSSKVGFPPWVVGLAAVVLLVAYGFFTYTMMGKAGDPNWDRILVLFQGVEALAFAAAGVLLGVQVQRSQVQQAEAKIEQKQKDGEDALKLVNRLVTDAESKAKTGAVDGVTREGAQPQAALAVVDVTTLKNMQTAINAILRNR